MFGGCTITQPNLSRGCRGMENMNGALPLVLVLLPSIYKRLHLLAPLSEELQGQSFAEQRSCCF